MDFHALIEGYLHSLEGRSGWSRTVRVAQSWILTLRRSPTRTDILARQKAICPGHYQPGATKANKELALIRAACNWGTYEGLWDGGNPTLGVRKFKTPKRTRIAKFDELRTILHALDFADSSIDRRDRALFGLEIFTACRPSEARMALRESIAPYGMMGCWQKGKTKNGQPHELPLPTQVMDWLSQVEEVGPYYFSHTPDKPIDESTVRKHWGQFLDGLGITGLWNYDLRRTFATYLQTELKQSDRTVQAILNHYDGRAIAHYVHPPFDFLAEVIQQYADWLLTLKGGPHETVHPRSTARFDARRRDGDRAGGVFTDRP